jgi:hypothetical protein
MVIFHSYVSLPEGTPSVPQAPIPSKTEAVSLPLHLATSTLEPPPGARWPLLEICPQQLSCLNTRLVDHTLWQTYVYIYVHREREIVNLVHWENSMVCMPNSVGFMVYTVCVYIYICMYRTSQWGL